MTELAPPKRMRRMPSPPQARPAGRGEAEGMGLRSPPARIGPYPIYGRLGAGGVGVVYEAQDPALGRRVAIKVLHDASPVNAARFRTEAQAMSRVSHPNVVTVFGVGETDGGGGYIVMELVRGQTMREWLDRTPPLADRLAVLEQAAQGLAAAHHVGVVHRDFKPENVLVGDDGRVRVVDFGLAKRDADWRGSSGVMTDHESIARDLVSVGVTQTDSLMGTPAYMAPEQFLGQGDARSDQFGFCVVAYELLFGQAPFVGDTAQELFEATRRGRLRPWPKASKVPVGVRSVLRRGLCPDPEDRFSSMHALLAALHRAMLTHRPSKVKAKRSRVWPWTLAGTATGVMLALGGVALVSGLRAPNTSRVPATRVDVIPAVDREQEKEPMTSAAPSSSVRPASRPAQS